MGKQTVECTCGECGLKRAVPRLLRRSAWIHLLTGFALCCVITAGCIGFGALLNRIDQARAEAHRAYAHTKLLEAQLVYVRSHPTADPRVDICLRRTEALKGAISAMLRVNAAAFERHPGTAWEEWK